jgi:kinesin family member 5
MIQTVFNKIESSSENVEFTLKVSMMEIYLENVKDLLNPTKDRLIIKQDPKKGIFIPDLTERYITCP